MAVIMSDTEYGAARATLEHHRVKGWLTEAEYNARLAELDEAYITGLEEEERGYGNRQYRMQQFERMEEAQRRMREAIDKRDRFGVKLLEKGDTGDYVIARMENGVAMQKIILSPLEARLLASEILSKVKPIKRKKKSWNIK